MPLKNSGNSHYVQILEAINIFSWKGSLTIYSSKVSRSLMYINKIQWKWIGKWRNEIRMKIYVDAECIFIATSADACGLSQ